MIHGSLFSGIGGFDLAAEWMGWKNLMHCEINPFGRKILNYYWPNAISYEDITKTDFTVHRGGINILTGGFPCQGFSFAGKRLGTDDDRYLWPEYLRAIREIQPAWVVGENVTGIVSMGEYEVFAKVDSRKLVRYHDIDHYEAIYTRQVKLLVPNIIRSLEKEGYKVQLFAIPAAGVGAPHKRERIWFVGHSELHGCPPSKKRGNESQSSFTSGEDKVRKSQRADCVQSGVASDSQSTGIQGNRTNREQEPRTPVEPGVFGCNYAADYWDQWPTESPICGGDDGIPSQLDGITFSSWRNESIKGYGNAIVPQVVYQIFTAIQDYENRRKKPGSGINPLP